MISTASLPAKFADFPSVCCQVGLENSEDRSYVHFDACAACGCIAWQLGCGSNQEPMIHTGRSLACDESFEGGKCCSRARHDGFHTRNKKLTEMTLEGKQKPLGKSFDFSFFKSNEAKLDELL